MTSLLCPLSVLAASSLFSMFGMGGGLVYMPLFLAFTGDVHQASLVSYLCILVTSLSAAVNYYRKGLVDRGLAVCLGLPLAAGICASGYLAVHLPAPVLKRTLAVVLAAGGAVLAYPPARMKRPRLSFPPLILAPLMAVTGLFCGLAGVTGGAFETFIMIGILGTAPHRAVGTTAVSVFVSAASGLSGRAVFRAGTAAPDAGLTAAVLVAAAAGGWLGPRISAGVEKQTFKRLCGLFLILLGLYYLMKTAF